MPGHFLSAEEAKAVVAGGVGMIEGIIKLTSSGLSASRVLDYAAHLDDEEEPPVLPAPNGPRPLTIQLHSFLRDPRQYSDTYGIEASQVAEWQSLARSEPEQARTLVSSYLSAHPRVVQSNRAVRVTLEGSPGSAPGSAQPLANATAITKSLKAEVRTNPFLYGSYQFEAHETPFDITRRYAVPLGGELFSLTFSKDSAIAVARIASVKGRQDPAVSPYVGYVDSSNRVLFGGDISSKVWDGKRGPRDKPPVSSRSISRVPPDAVARGSERTQASSASSARPESRASPRKD